MESGDGVVEFAVHDLGEGVPRFTDTMISDTVLRIVVGAHLF